MKKYEKCSIFFDTNAFEYRQNDKILLSEIKASSLFYDTLRTIELFGLSERVQICIPEIVWEEVKLHMVKEYKSAIDSLNSKIKEAQQVLGELVDVSYEFNDVNGVSEYKQYVEEISQEFLNNPKNKVVVIKCPNDVDTIGKIVDKALHGTPPFTEIKTNKKTYSDAGFKDALIWETVQNSKDNELLIFVTKDFDFNKVDKNGINVCSSSFEIKNLLIDNMSVSSEGRLLNRLLDCDSELVQRILTECGFDDYKTVNIDPLMEHWLDKYDDGSDTSVLNILCDIVVDNVMHRFTIRYDINANDLIDAYCDIQI